MFTALIGRLIARSLGIHTIDPAEVDAMLAAIDEGASLYR